MENKTFLQHELRKEFHNIVGILKIIKSENLIVDTEVKEMIDVGLERESLISNHFEKLSLILEGKDV